MSHPEHRAKLAATATVNDHGQFEIHAITAGMGNGWNFTEAALSASIKLWDGVNSMVDHVGWFDMPSVMKLGGVAHSPEWDADAKAIKLTLKPFGPLGAAMQELATEYLAARQANQPVPNVGFSADIGFTAKGQEVIAITRVHSLDLVLDPARGGDFIAALQQVRAIQELPPTQGYRPQESRMSDPSTTPSPASTQATAPAGTLSEQLKNDAAAVRMLLGEQTKLQAVQAEADAMRAIRLQSCKYLLDTALAASHLPAPSQDHIRKTFAERVFEPNELTGAIDDQRALAAQLTAGAVVQGPGRISAMFDGNDQIQVAMDDLLGAERAPALKNLKVHKLSGIREAYIGFTADHDFTGAFNFERALFQHTTATFPSLVKNAMNKVIATRWEQLGKAGYDWWDKIATVEHLNDLKTVTWIITGTVGDLPTVAEGAEYTELQTGDGEETSAVVTYGGYVGITRRALINDDTKKLRAIPLNLANAGMRKISRLVAAIFTDNSGIGPTLADTGALFNNTAVTTAGGHANLLTTALGTTYTAWEAAAAAMYNQPMLIRNAATYYGTGDKQALDPKFCLVPRALKGQAEALFIPRWQADVEAIAAAGGPTYGGHVIPLTVPEWTDATDWAAVADPLLAPGVMIGHPFGLMPSIFIAGDERDPAMFANDEARIKARHELAVGVADYRPLHKSNV